MTFGGMVNSRRSVRAPLPPAGSILALNGDSISDPWAYGQWWQILAARYGWKVANVNQIPNSGVENLNGGGTQVIMTDGSAFPGSGANTQYYWGATGVTVTADNGTTPVPHEGAWQAKLNNSGTAISYVSIGGDSGGMRLGMNAGTPYTFSCWMYVPTAAALAGSTAAAVTTGPNTPASPSYKIEIQDYDGATYQATTSPTIAAANAYLQMSVTRTIRTTAIGAWTRIYHSSVSANTPIYVDAVQLEANSVVTTYANSLTRGAVFGTLLAGFNPSDLTGTNPGNTIPKGGLASVYSARAGVWSPNITITLLGTNDYLFATNSTTPTTFRTQVQALFTQMASQNPNATHVICGILPRNPGSSYTAGSSGTANAAGFTPQNTALIAGGGWATADDDVKNQFDAVLQQETLRMGPNWLFVRLRDMPAAYQAPTQATSPNPPYPMTDGIHPYPTGITGSGASTVWKQNGHQWIADRISGAFGGE